MSGSLYISRLALLRAGLLSLNRPFLPPPNGCYTTVQDKGLCSFSRRRKLKVMANGMGGAAPGPQRTHVVVFRAGPSATSESLYSYNICVNQHGCHLTVDYKVKVNAILSKSLSLNAYVHGEHVCHAAAGLVIVSMEISCRLGLACNS